MRYGIAKQTVWHSASRGIIRLGLASLAMATINSATTESVKAEISYQLTKAVSELPVVQSSALDTNLNVPWSKPVRIVDPFEGDYVGIFDRNYFFRYFLDTYARIEVVSLWSQKSARFLVTYSDRDCLSGRSLHYGPGFRHGKDLRYASLSGVGCADFNRVLKVTDLFVKVGERVFRLEGQNSTFSVSNELASVLKNSPAENISIRLAAENGAVVDSEIGKRTVEAWKAIY